MMPSSTNSARADEAGTGYQTMINEALRSYLAGGADTPVTEGILRRVIREELPASGAIGVPCGSSDAAALRSISLKGRRGAARPHCRG
jgi:hypothetical protein